MTEYIKREEVLRHKRKMSGVDFGGEFWDCAVLCEDVEKIQAADVVEVRHGEWEEIIDTKSTIHRYQHPCGVCGQSYFDNNKFNHPYCPNCGADMRGGNHGKK